ncbi:MAG: hypothetical protein IKN76_01185, partial [Oscillospiraceae bacterium]|nr:hypothetical protein [Oscillospiraceae bacterium]
MRETDLGSTEKQYMSLTENIAANGPMDERKAMDLARALCSRMLDESGITEALELIQYAKSFTMSLRAIIKVFIVVEHIAVSTINKKTEQI